MNFQQRKIERNEGIYMGKNCGYCAYAAKKNGKATWCKFHGETVTDNNVCDDFLHFMDNPLISERLDQITKPAATSQQSGKHKDRVTGKTKISMKVKIKDFFAWFLILLFIFAGIMVFLYF